MIAALVNETRKNLLLAWSYRVNIIMWVVFDIVMFTGVMLLFGDGSDTARLESRPSYLLGFLVTNMASGAVSTMAWGLRDEMQSGTLEQMTMSPHSLNWLVLGRLTAETVVSLILRIIVGVGIILVMNLSLPFTLAMLPVFILTLLGMYGVGFMVGGLALIFKRIDSVAAVFTNLLMWINGTFVAIAFFPAGLAFVARLMPVTQGLIVLRQLMFDELTLATTWSDGTLPWLIVHSVGLLIAGIVFFQWCERRAKALGSMAQY